MKYLSVCSGIEAATVAWHPLGWEPVAFGEIEKFPSQVLAHHYPDTPNWGDMTKFKEWPDANVNVFVGGTPCQSFSVAGLRKGLDDPRGNLMLTYLAIAAKYRPQWLVWENVPGVLSSNGGHDFASLLRGMGECGYGFAYRILDAQYFGVAQRRRRVFVVGYLGDWQPAAAVLFERHSLSGHPAPSREKGKSFAASIASGASISDYDIAGTLDKGTPGRGIGHNGNYDSQVVSVGSLCARTGQSRSVQDAEQGHLLATQPIPIDTMNHIGRGDHHSMGDFLPGAPSYTLTKNHSHAVAHSIATHDVAGTMLSRKTSGGFSNSIDHAAAGYMALQPIALAENTIGRKPENGGNGDGFTEEGPMYTLNATGVHGVAQPIALQDIRAVEKMQGGKGWNEDGTAYTIDTWATQGVAQPIPFDTTQITSPQNGNNPKSGDPCHPLAAGAHPPAIAAQMAVRRLTPKECERLQGFPDNYTDIQHKGKATPDGPRYKALGNSMAVPVMAWIGSRIQKVQNILDIRENT